MYIWMWSSQADSVAIPVVHIESEGPHTLYPLHRLHHGKLIRFLTKIGMSFDQRVKIEASRTDWQADYRDPVHGVEAVAAN